MELASCLGNGFARQNCGRNEGVSEVWTLRRLKRTAVTARAQARRPGEGTGAWEVVRASRPWSGVGCDGNVCFGFLPPLFRGGMEENDGLHWRLALFPSELLPMAGGQYRPGPVQDGGKVLTCPIDQPLPSYSRLLAGFVF